MIMTWSLKMRKLERPSLIWRIASCRAMVLAAACHSPTVCKKCLSLILFPFTSQLLLVVIMKTVKNRKFMFKFHLLGAMTLPLTLNPMD